MNKRSEPELEMVIDIRVLEHLGLKMYNSLPAVISEYVANAWDAGATVVDISIPKKPMNENYQIIIQDDGCGMTVDDVNIKFLAVGRQRRKEENIDTITVDGVERKIIGRKGLGKIAGFGIAGIVEITTRQNGRFVQFQMDYDKIQEAVGGDGSNQIKTTYKPIVIDWGKTKDDDGTIVVLTRLKRKRAIRLKELRRNLAHHFSVIGRNFKLRVNSKAITPKERSLEKQCEYTWNYDDKLEYDKRDISISGWIGTMKDTIPRDQERGIIIMARGKLVQEPSTYDIGGKGITGQHGLAYLVGEIHADFLDDEEDLISTGRRSVVWEVEPAASLRVWLNDTIKSVCKDWAKKRREGHMKIVKQHPVYKARIERLPPREKKIVDKFMGTLVRQEQLDEATIGRVVDFAASNVEYQAFLSFVDTLEEADMSNPEVIIEFFREWEVLDAIDMIRLVEGRFEVMTKFQQLIETQAREVPTLHKFLADNPWLLDPSWDYLQDEVTYSKLLLDEFPDADKPEEDRRIDFLCLGYGRTLNVIELKKPGVAIGVKELRQLEDYVLFIEPRLGTSQSGYMSVQAYIIGSKISNRPEAMKLAKRLANVGSYVRTFDELQSATYRIHRRFIEILERKAERTDDVRLLEGLARLKTRVKAPQSEAVS